MMIGAFIRFVHKLVITRLVRLSSWHRLFSEWRVARTHTHPTKLYRSCIVSFLHGQLLAVTVGDPHDNNLIPLDTVGGG